MFGTNNPWLVPRGGAALGFTGKELLVFGGVMDDKYELNDGAAFVLPP